MPSKGSALYLLVKSSNMFLDPGFYSVPDVPGAEEDEVMQRQTELRHQLCTLVGPGLWGSLASRQPHRGGLQQVDSSTLDV